MPPRTPVVIDLTTDDDDSSSVTVVDMSDQASKQAQRSRKTKSRKSARKRAKRKAPDTPDDRFMMSPKKARRHAEELFDHQCEQEWRHGIHVQHAVETRSYAHRRWDPTPVPLPFVPMQQMDYRREQEEQRRVNEAMKDLYEASSMSAIHEEPDEHAARWSDEDSIEESIEDTDIPEKSPTEVTIDDILDISYEEVLLEEQSHVEARSSFEDLDTTDEPVEVAAAEASPDAWDDMALIFLCSDEGELEVPFAVDSDGHKPSMLGDALGTLTLS